jgi:nucleotide-binding universal stress UspA family protein
MYDRILIGIDFSDSSVETVRWAVSRFPTAEIVLFHAIEPLSVPDYLSRVLGGGLELMREKELDARTNLEHLAEGVGIEATLEVRLGWAPEALAVTADEVGAELVVVGAHQRRINPTDELGNTCSAIVRKTNVPVLVWRPVINDRDKTILAALDLREGSAPIAATAAEYADYFNARLLLLHAIPSTLQGYLRAVNTPPKVEEALRNLESEARRDALARVPVELRDRVAVQVAIVRGKPVVSHILNTAEREAADLIVIGKYHAPGLVARVLLGGITSAVIQNANCSVLTVPL